MTKEEQVKLFQEVLIKESYAIMSAHDIIMPNSIVEAAKLIIETNNKLVVISLGKGGYIGEKLSASFSSMGMPSFFVHATELFHGDFGRISNGDTVLMLSHSGETKEIVAAGEELKKRNIPITSITKNRYSSLAKLSNVVLFYGDFMEADHIDMAPTNSSTVMLAVGDALMVLVSKLIGYTAIDFKKNHPGGSLGKKEILNR